MSSGTEGWERQFDELFRTVKLETLQNIALKQRTLEAALTALNGQFMRQFISQTFGVSATPGYARDQGQSWKKLNDKYARKKGHSNFYKKSGNLKRYMNLWSYSKAFGNDKTTLLGEAVGISDSAGRSPAGGSFTKSGRFFAGGQFLPKEDPSKWLPKGISVVLFPNLAGAGALRDNDSYAQQIEAAVFGETSLAYFKFNNPGGGRKREALKRLRPAFGTFTLWWLKHKTQAILQTFDPSARIF